MLSLRVAAVSSLLAGACSFEPGKPGAQDIDAGLPDSETSGCNSFSTQLDTCALMQSSMSLTLTGDHTYDTTMGKLFSGTTPIAITRMQLAGKAGPLEVLIVDDFRLTANARLRAVGNLPLAIVAFGSIAIDGSALIDVADGGAGARTTCSGGAISGMPDNGGAGGGGGGGFAALGGSGGNGNGDGSSPTPGGPGGAAAAAIPLGPLGGCPGASGGNGDDDGGPGGKAGGAIYLVAATRIELAPGSGINAGGGGGGGGRVSFASNGDAGGGGGGSGGMIMIESPIVRVVGTLAANGGGGGEASGGGSSGNGGHIGALGTSSADGGDGNSSSG